jgi:hypothetical protein
LGYLVVFIAGDVQAVTLHPTSICQAKMEIKKESSECLTLTFARSG